MRKALCILILVSVLACAFAADNESVRTFFPANASPKAVFPIDAVIGQTCPVDASEDHGKLFAMLTEPYSFEWTQSHLSENERAALVQIFGSWLSANLGQGEVLMSVASKNAEGSVGISVRKNGSCMAFVLKDDLIIAMREL